MLESNTDRGPGREPRCGPRRGDDAAPGAESAGLTCRANAEQAGAFLDIRELPRYGHMLAFAQALPAVRERVARDMGRRGLPREKVLATVVHLLETTLRPSHVEVEAPALRFQFKDRNGKAWRVQVNDRRIARIVKTCQELPGQELFQYLDDAGGLRHVTSGDVNGYLGEIAGHGITARDFRLWAGTVQTALALHALQPFESQARAQKNVRAAIERVAARLGSTPALCRQCCVHPEILSAYAAGELLLDLDGLDRRAQALRPEEAAVLALLRARSSRTLSQVLRENIAVARRARREKLGWGVDRSVASGAPAAHHC